MASEMGPDEGEPSPSTESGTDSTPFTPVAPAPPPASPPPSAPPPGLPPYPAQQWPGYGQAPTGPYGYPPYGHGYPQQPPTGTNGMAVAALVLGICGFLFVTPIVGLILGLVALSAVKRSGQKGKGLAISGIVLSGVWIAVFATIITVAVIETPDPARRDANGTVVGAGAVPVFGLHPKDCFTMPSGVLGSTDSKLRNFTVVPCSTPHDSEAFGSFEASDGSYPGTALRAKAVSQCIKILDGYLPDLMSLPNRSRVQFIYPNAQTWDSGVHRVTCFILFPAATMTQSVYRDPSSYTADQRRFLDATRPMADDLGLLNATMQSATLEVLKNRANDIATAAQAEVTTLGSAPWPGDAQSAVDALAAKQIEMVQLWRRAVGDSDMASFEEDVRQADSAFDVTDTQAARTALGLTPINAGGSGGTAQTTA